MGARQPDYRPDRTSSNARPFDSANARFICSSWKYRGRVTRSVLRGTRVRSTSSNVPKRCMFLVSGSKRGQTGVSRRSADPVRARPLPIAQPKVKFGKRSTEARSLATRPCVYTDGSGQLCPNSGTSAALRASSRKTLPYRLHRRSVEMNEGPRRMEMSAKFDPTASGKSAQQQQHEGASEPATGDVAPKGTAGTGEAICPECEGTGKIEGKVCENCGGSGKIIQGVGGA